MNIRLLPIVLFLPIAPQAQEMLSKPEEMVVTADGREFRIDSYRISEDGSMLDVRTCLTCVVRVDNAGREIQMKKAHSKRFSHVARRVADSGGY